MEKDFIFINCEHCGQLNKIDTNAHIRECEKCGKKIIIPQNEKRIIVNN